MPTVMVSCGEASGDLYAGALATELKRLAPGTRVFGLGGPRLAESGAELVGDYRGLAVTGLTEALRVLPRSFGMLRRLRARMVNDRPDVLVAIDFPDFNFGLARSARRLGIPVVYYISPQLWAWRPGRIQTMKAIATKVLVDLPLRAADLRTCGDPGRVRRPPADRSHPRHHGSHGSAAVARPRRRGADGGVATGQPTQRGARHPAGPGGLRRLGSCADSQRAVRHRARAEPRRRRCSYRWHRRMASRSSKDGQTMC